MRVSIINFFILPLPLYTPVDSEKDKEILNLFHKCNKLQTELGENKYAVCAPTHKASLIIGAVTVYNLFNISDLKT